MNDGRGFRLVPCAACGSDPDEHRPLMKSHVRHPGHLLGQPLSAVTCSSCGLSFLNPQPTPDALARFYSNEYYSGQSSQDFDIDEHLHAKAWQREILFDWLIAHLPEPQAWSILDIGCGYGAWLRNFGDSNRLLGIEQAVQAATIAGERFGVEVHQTDFMQNGLPAGSFDLVSGLAIIEHFVDPLAALVEINRILRPDGYLYLQTPDLRGLVLRRGIPRFFKLVHTYYFSLTTLAGLCEKAGFEVVAARERRPVLTTSDFLRPRNFLNGEIDLLVRKRTDTDLSAARARAGRREDPEAIMAVVQEAWERDRVYAAMQLRYKWPIVGAIMRLAVGLAFAISGRSVRKEDVRKAQVLAAGGVR